MLYVKGLLSSILIPISFTSTTFVTNINKLFDSKDIQKNMSKLKLLMMFLISIQFVSSRKPTLWKSGNYNSLYNLSTADLKDFMAFKEEQYTRRKLFIRQKCKEYSKDLNQHSSQYSRDPKLGKYIVNPKDNIAICQIPKSASSTWLYRFNYLLENGQGPNFTTLSNHEHSKMADSAPR